MLKLRLLFIAFLVPFISHCGNAPKSQLAQQQAVEQASKSQLVQLEDALRSTSSYLKLGSKDISRFFDNGAVLAQYDFSDLKQPLEDIMQRFHFEHLTFDAQKNKPLLTIQLNQEQKFTLEQDSAITVDKNIGLSGFGDTASGNWLFKVFGFSLNGSQIKSVEWDNNEGLILHLEDGNTAPLSIEPFLSFYEDYEEEIEQLILKFEDKPKFRAADLVDSSLKLFTWFKTTDAKNILRVPFNKDSQYFTYLTPVIDKLNKVDSQLGEFISSLRLVELTPQALKINFDQAHSYLVQGDKVKLNRSITVTPSSQTRFSLEGVFATKPRSQRWYPVYHGENKQDGTLVFETSVPRLSGNTRIKYKTIVLPEL